MKSRELAGETCAGRTPLTPRTVPGCRLERQKAACLVLTYLQRVATRRGAALIRKYEFRPAPLRLNVGGCAADSRRARA